MTTRYNVAKLINATEVHSQLLDLYRDSTSQPLQGIADTDNLWDLSINHQI